MRQRGRVRAVHVRVAHAPIGRVRLSIVNHSHEERYRARPSGDQLQVLLDKAIQTFPERIDDSRYQKQVALYLAAGSEERILPVFVE